ncbi:hypothetical protein DPMN_070454 [Dreissena polymorpha]|uniref:Uncharacterized protein n=1 Tax=Dreissena polymorpha TaxID=45954 RepID=A0A9D4BNX8_DREPO|nr:hypothetical protein DPMN_070454 [Dreissena polymorpha]
MVKVKGTSSVTVSGNSGSATAVSVGSIVTSILSRRVMLNVPSNGSGSRSAAADDSFIDDELSNGSRSEAKATDDSFIDVELSNGSRSAATVLVRAVSSSSASVSVVSGQCLFSHCQHMKCNPSFRWA